jgi:NADH-quinone oxidoreductase subunit J
MEKYIFLGLSGIAIFSAIMMLVSKKPIHSLLYLVLCFFAIAGHYLMLNAQFLAVVHIIVYAGAIMVLFLFTVMLLNLNLKLEINKTILTQVIAVISAGLVLISFVGAFKGLTADAPEFVTSQMGTAQNLGSVLFKEYMLPFEAASLLFLSAMVGAVMLVKK